MATRIREHIPLLHVLNKIPPAERQIILSHLSDASCVQIERCIETVLKLRKRIPKRAREDLRHCIRENQAIIQKIFSARTPGGKRKALTSAGGGIFSLLFGVGIPLLLSLIKA